MSIYFVVWHSVDEWRSTSKRTPFTVPRPSVWKTPVIVNKIFCTSLERTYHHREIERERETHEEKLVLLFFYGLSEKSKINKWNVTPIHMVSPHLHVKRKPNAKHKHTEPSVQCLDWKVNFEIRFFVRLSCLSKKVNSVTSTTNSVAECVTKTFVTVNWTDRVFDSFECVSQWLRLVLLFSKMAHTNNALFET